MNWNVKIIIYFMFVRSTFSSLFDQTPLSYYVLLLTGSNAKVGLVQGLQGFINLASAFPFAAIGDRWSRQGVLRFSGGVGFLAILATVALLVDGDKKLVPDHYLFYIW